MVSDSSYSIAYVEKLCRTIFEELQPTQTSQSAVPKRLDQAQGSTAPKAIKIMFDSGDNDNWAYVQFEDYENDYKNGYDKLRDPHQQKVTQKQLDFLKRLIKEHRASVLNSKDSRGPRFRPEKLGIDGSGTGQPARLTENFAKRQPTGPIPPARTNLGRSAATASITRGQPENARFQTHNQDPVLNRIGLRVAGEPNARARIPLRAP